LTRTRLYAIMCNRFDEFFDNIKENYFKLKNVVTADSVLDSAPQLAKKGSEVQMIPIALDSDKEASPIDEAEFETASQNSAIDENIQEQFDKPPMRLMVMTL